MNDRPRIIIDAIAYAPRDGGFTTALHDLLDTCRRIPEFEFVVVHDRKYNAVFRRFGLATYSVAVPRGARFFASLVLLPVIARRIGATAVHCEISAKPWFLGVPGSITVHDLYFLIDRGADGRTFRQRAMRVYWRRVFIASVRRARVIKAISVTTADDLRRLVSPRAPIVLAGPRFVAPARRTSTRCPPGPREELRLLFLGSVVPRRNLPFLLRSLKLVRRPWRLDVVGGLWWGTDELEPMATDGRVRFHGYVPDAERERLMTEAHLLIAPSRYEGFGYPAAEAMVRGLPVVTSDVGAFREFVPKDWRFPLEDPVTLASLIDNLSEADLARMAETGRDAVRQFDLGRHVDSHRELFGRLVFGSGSAGGSPVDRLAWRPGRLDRARALLRRVLLSTLGDGIEGRLRSVYHRALRRAGRFRLPEDDATQAVLAAAAARSRTILDIGANVGLYAWFLLRHASQSSQLFAFEPNPAAAELLRGAIGALPQCRVLEVAAGERDEMAELVVPDGPFGAPVSALSWVRRPGDGDAERVLEITVCRIDSLIQDGTIRVTGPVFMKIDTEGAEASVLRGASGLLRRHHPVIYFECQANSAARTGETPGTVWDELQQAGYDVLANRGGRFTRVDRAQPDVPNYLAIPGYGDGDRTRSMDAAEVIAVLDHWAESGSPA